MEAEAHLFVKYSLIQILMRAHQMQAYVNQILTRYGHQDATISILHTDNPMYAYAIDCNPVVLPLRGAIYYNSLLDEATFTDAVIQFIIAHEYMHILKNHLLATTLANGVEELLKGSENQNYALVDFLKAILKPGEILIRIQECDADWGALEITKNLQSADTCLRKLVNGNLGLPSHTWELFHMEIPAMSMEERISELRRRENSKHPSAL
jgi:Zn-dependent protease with chaperone function